MKIITVDGHDFADDPDQIATESSVYEGLLANIDLLSPELNYVALPMNKLVNTRGIEYYQDIIDKLEKEFPVVKKYVCQHICVNINCSNKRFNFYDNIVYTPHTLLDDDYRVVPHYNACINKDDYVPYTDRQYDFSFRGTYGTHELRPQLGKLHNGDNVIVQDTGRWHFFKPVKYKNRYKNSYKSILGNSKFALCPPGTGVSTLRLYEAMAAGAFPIVFNTVKVPKIVEDYVIRLNSIDDLDQDKLLSTFTAEQSLDLHSIYWDNLSNDKLFSFITEA